MKTFVQRAFATRVLVTLVLSAIIGCAYADDEKGYRTGTMVASQHNECRGVPACLSTTSPAVVVPAAGRKAERLACPISHPNLWAWDAAQHEQIQVHLVAADKSTVTIEGVNVEKVAGVFVVSLGCSTEPYTGTGFHQSRHLAPVQRSVLPTPETDQFLSWGLGISAQDLYMQRGTVCIPSSVHIFPIRQPVGQCLLGRRHQQPTLVRHQADELESSRQGSGGNHHRLHLG